MLLDRLVCPDYPARRHTGALVPSNQQCHRKSRSCRFQMLFMTVSLSCAHRLQCLSSQRGLSLNSLS